ncbi:MAG: DUF58 domain-containing protein [Anaerolineales bacterium]|nr:DUF58 domain-containing protein [Anaerolineales bacterium]
MRAPFLPALTAALVIVQLFAPGKEWTALLIAVGGVWLIGWAWIRELARHLTLVREVRFGWAHVGDLLEERFSLINTGWAPAVWVDVLDRSTMPSYDPSRVSGVGRYSETRWQTKGLCARRGVYMLGPTSIVAQDPFGIYRLEMEYPAASTMAVMPPVIPLTEIDIAPGGRTGDGRMRIDAQERTVDASTVRGYLPGDSLRWIHWPTSARKGTLHVRLFDGMPVGDWWIFIDMQRACQAGEGEHSTDEHAVVLAASLAARGIGEGRAVGLVGQGARDLYWFPPRQGETQLWDILRALAMISPAERPLGDLLSQLQPRETARSSVILITPEVSGRWLEPLLRLMRRGIKPTVLLLDPASYGGKGDSGPLASQLLECGIIQYRITRDLLGRQDLRPGTGDGIKWKVTPRGRAIISEKVDLSWKELA